MLSLFTGTVYVYLPNHEERYEWNKVTSCVHNLYGGGQRWVDQYGEMIITNKTKNITCKLTFVKVNLLFFHIVTQFLFFLK